MNNFLGSRSGDILNFEAFSFSILPSLPMTSFSGGSFIELPDEIKKTRACVNIKNTDDRCLLYCLSAFDHYEDEKHKNRKDKNNPSMYEEYMHEIKIPDKLVFPIDVSKDIPKFEQLNHKQINVFQLVDGKVCVLYNKYKRDNNIPISNLLLIHERDKSHFVLIRNLGSLMF